MDPINPNIKATAVKLVPTAPAEGFAFEPSPLPSGKPGLPTSLARRSGASSRPGAPAELLPGEDLLEIGIRRDVRFGVTATETQTGGPELREHRPIKHRCRAGLSIPHHAGGHYCCLAHVRHFPVAIHVWQDADVLHLIKPRGIRGQDGVLILGSRPFLDHSHVPALQEDRVGVNLHAKVLDVVTGSQQPPLLRAGEHGTFGLAGIHAKHADLPGNRARFETLVGVPLVPIGVFLRQAHFDVQLWLLQLQRSSTALADGLERIVVLLGVLLHHPDHDSLWKGRVLEDRLDEDMFSTNQKRPRAHAGACREQARRIVGAQLTHYPRLSKGRDEHDDTAVILDGDVVLLGRLRSLVALSKERLAHFRPLVLEQNDIGRLPVRFRGRCFLCACPQKCTDAHPEREKMTTHLQPQGSAWRRRASEPAADRATSQNPFGDQPLADSAKNTDRPFLRSSEVGFDLGSSPQAHVGRSPRNFGAHEWPYSPGVS
eukprot:scaffold7340_cov266-Pinguiococcus_pyrenoidosus.AAC.81